MQKPPKEQNRKIGRETRRPAATGEKNKDPGRGDGEEKRRGLSRHDTGAGRAGQWAAPHISPAASIAGQGDGGLKGGAAILAA
jgi:hypothetical protein